MENTLWCMLCTTTFIKNHLYSGTLSNTTPHFHMDGLPYASIRFVIIICTYTHKMKLLTENKIKKKIDYILVMLDALKLSVAFWLFVGSVVSCVVFFYRLLESLFEKVRVCGN